MQHTLNKAAKDGFVRAFTTFLIVKELCDAETLFCITRFVVVWWSQAGSNRRPPACKAGALPAELWPQILVGLGRFELPTSPLSGVRSNQLSYRPKASRCLNIDLRSRAITEQITCEGARAFICKGVFLLFKGGDPAARSRTATLLRLHPSH